MVSQAACISFGGDADFCVTYSDFLRFLILVLILLLFAIVILSTFCS